MKSLIALMLLASSLAHAAREDCTYDPDYAQGVLSKIAQRLDGAMREGNELRWIGAEGEVTILGIGGCHDRGTQLTRSTPMSAPRTREQVFALARELASSYLAPEIEGGKTAGESLLLGLQQSTYQTHSSDGTTRYQVEHAQYIELQVTHRFHEGVDEVSISWYENT